MNRSTLTQAVIDRLERYPPPHDAHYGVVPAPPPEEPIPLGAYAALHGEAIAAMGRIDAMAARSRDPFVISRVLERQEAVSSSAIEGTNSTLDELLTAEVTADDDMRVETRQTRDYALALAGLLNHARAQGPGFFVLNHIKVIHRRVKASDPDYPDRPGALRTTSVWIGGADIAYSTWNPPPAGHVERCLEETIAYMRADGPQAVNQNLVTRMAVAHAHFEAVHPFRDGNGRVGRLLLPLMMAAEGHAPLYLSAYIEANRPAYYEALRDAQQRLQWPSMVAFMSRAIIGTVSELDRTLAALSRLQALWLGRRPFRAGSAALRTIHTLPDFPVLTVFSLAMRLGVSTKAAATAVDQLVEAGILKERTGYRRNRIFSASEALSIMNRPFGDEPVLPER